MADGIMVMDTAEARTKASEMKIIAQEIEDRKSLSWGAREVGSPCEWRGGARHCSRAMVGECGLETC